MSENDLIKITEKTFEEIKHIDENGNEYWYARELMITLGYKDWRYFDAVIEKAKIACKNSEMLDNEHFVVDNKTSKMPNGGFKPMKDYILSRYACYLIAQNGDVRKEEIAFAQSYFAIQTRKQELIEERMLYIQRAEARDRLKISEKKLSQNIYERGVDEKGFGRIRSKGDQALFGGKTTKDMKSKYGISDNRPLADFLPTVTIAAKNLATEMTNYNVEEKDLQGENSITDEHIQNNTSVRSMLMQRGIQPENLPASEDMKKLERRVIKSDKNLAEKSGKFKKKK